MREVVVEPAVAEVVMAEKVEVGSLGTSNPFPSPVAQLVKNPPAM